MNHPLKNALPIVAAAYGKKFGVKVHIAGTEAYTDGQRIVIPAAGMDDARYQSIAWGYLAHEAAHVRHTDFDVVSQTAGQPLRKAILNILEDARIEARLAKDYPGTRRTIEAVLAYMVDQGSMSLPQQPTPVVILQSWLLGYVRSQYLKQTALTPLYQQSTQLLEQTLDQPSVLQLNQLAGQISLCQNTEETLNLTDQILAVLQSVADEGQPSTTGNGDERSQADGDHSPTNTTAANASKILSANEADLIEDLFTQISDELGQQASAGPPSDGIKPLNLPQPEQAQRGSNDLLKATLQTSAHLRTHLQGLVQASQENRTHPKRHGRGIDLKRLARSQTGETRLFIKRHPRIAPNTAVHLLVDISSSMSKSDPETGQRSYQLANQAALALALALEVIPGVTLAVSYFPGHRSDVTEVLRTGQSARRQAAFFDQKPRGCTPMAPAIWYAAHQFLQQKQTRKLMIVITDGAPDDEESTRDVIGRCQQNGFELLGVGIQTVSVKHLFSESVVVSNLPDLKHGLFTIMENRLVAR